MVHRLNLKRSFPNFKRTVGRAYGYFVSSFFKVLIVYIYLNYLKYRPILNEYLYCRNNDTDTMDTTSSNCKWHFYGDDFFTGYLFVLILWNYFSASWLSPGIVEVASDADAYADVNVSCCLSSSSYMTRMYGAVPSMIMSNTDSDEVMNVTCMPSLPSLAVKQNEIDNKSNRNIHSHSYNYNYSNNPKSSESSDEYEYHGASKSSSSWSMCTKCKPARMRPPRAHHCSMCDSCTLRFDHHCPYINNCVGLNNYRNYFLTVLYINISIVYGIKITLPIYIEAVKVRLKMVSSDQLPFLRAFVDFPFYLSNVISHHPTIDPDEHETSNALYMMDMAIFALPVMVIAFPMLYALLCSHVILILKGLTTCETVIESQRLFELQKQKWKKRIKNVFQSSVADENEVEVGEKSKHKNHHSDKNNFRCSHCVDWKKILGMFIAGVTGIVLLYATLVISRIYYRGFRPSQDATDVVILGVCVLIYVVGFQLYRSSNSHMRKEELVAAYQEQLEDMNQQSSSSSSPSLSSPSSSSSSKIDKSKHKKKKGWFHISSTSPYYKHSMMQSFQEVLGPRLLLCLLPINVKMPPPARPNNEKSD